METGQRKVYEIPVHEVAGYLSGVPHAQLLSAPMAGFPPAYHYLIYIYRNAWTAPRHKPLTQLETLNVVVGFHRSLRSELLRAIPEERELKKKAFLRAHELCIKYKIVHPVFNFNRKGRIGGDSDGKEIRLNYVLYKENVEEYLNQVIHHELCHHWHFQLGTKGTAHGKEWKDLMRRMGVKPDRCHRMDTTTAETVQNKRFHVYSCSCPEVAHVTAKRHQQIQSALLNHKPVNCFKCKQPMGYDGIDRTLLSKVVQLA